jgi:hypothetical protein
VNKNESAPVTLQAKELGAICTFAPNNPADGDDPSTRSFAVSEYVELDSGERVILHNDRGFTISARSTTGDTELDLRADDIVADLEQTVRNVVLPDEEPCEEDHPYEKLAGLAQQKGLNIAANALRKLPYKVEFGADVLEWLSER